MTRRGWRSRLLTTFVVAVVLASLALVVVEAAAVWRWYVP
jgi:hypothetical protein